MSIFASGATALIIGGLVVAAVIAAVGQPRVGVMCGFELWLAAGLLRLGTNRAWPAIATAALVVVLRRVLGQRLLRSHASTEAGA